jgi:alpha-L-rhamnosidase
LNVYDIKCNERQEPFLDQNDFCFSWKITGPVGGRQTAYRLCAAGSPERLDDDPDLWDSGWVLNCDSFGVVYAGRPLESRERAFWRVRVRDNHGNESDWSETACVEMALIDPGDWSADWIQMKREPALTASLPTPFFRKEFRLDSVPGKARLYLSALGDAKVFINGRQVGDDFFSPGFTDYSRRIQYLAHDVTELLCQGENCIAAAVGDGWYCGNIAWNGQRCFYGNEQKLLLQLECSQDGNETVRIGSDSSWTCATGPILEADHYNGEIHDARLEFPGWNASGFDASGWAPVIVDESPKAPLELKRCAAVRRQEELHPVSVVDPNGARIYDFGQNMVGLPRITVKGTPGANVKIRFAEILQQDGTLYTENYRSARSIDRYICKSSELETWEPSFTFHGFRYVELSGDAEFRDDAVVATVLHTDLPLTGFFECSDPMINRLQKNIVWGQKSNFLEVPTDCPQRDERLGWTGDSLAFIRTAAFNMDIYSFYRKWLTDLRDAQREDGAFPDMAPFVTCGYGNAGWGDAGVFCPWEIYCSYGDAQVLAENYKAMCAWVSYLEQTADHLICPDTRYGDWLAIDSPDKFNAPTPKRLIGTAFFARCADILAMTADVLGKPDDVARFEKLAREVRAAFNREFVSDDGDVAGETQTGYLLAIGFDLLPPEKRVYAANRLVERVESRGHLTTGFIGTPLLNPVLTKIGRSDLAYDLLFRREYPSWLYPIDQGATTMWERWNSYSHADGFGDAEMNSFNHYAYGAIGEWLYQSVAGIQPAAPAYKQIRIAPVIDSRLSFVKAGYETPYGPLNVEWNRTESGLTICGEIPFNTTGRLLIPDGFDCPAASIGGDEIDAEGALCLQAGAFHVECVEDAVAPRRIARQELQGIE